MSTNDYSEQWFKLFMPPMDDAATRRDVEFIVRQLPLPRYRRILDLCCGYGRHAIPLARGGYAVTGLDRDAQAIAQAQANAERERVAPNFVIGDLLDLAAVEKQFDAIINMWQSLHYFDEATNNSILREIVAHLTPGGRFIIDMYNRDFFMEHQGTREQLIDGVRISTHGYLDGNRWNSVLTYRNERQVLGHDHMEWQLFTADEFVAMARASGLTLRLVCAWMDESIRLSPETARMQIVFEKLLDT